jgi:hypothetical protein
MDDINLDDIDMNEWRPDNPDYTYEHWYNTLEQSYDPTINPDVDVGDKSDDDGIDDVMVDLALYKMELKIIELQLELHELESRLKSKHRRGIPQRISSFTGPMLVHWVSHNPNPNTCYERFRMWPATYIALCNTL